MNYGQDMNICDDCFASSPEVELTNELSKFRFNVQSFVRMSVLVSVKYCPRLNRSLSCILKPLEKSIVDVTTLSDQSFHLAYLTILPHL